jgi:hypothetical protein
MKLCFALLCILCLALPVWSQVKITQGSDRILIDIDGKPFTQFFIGTGAPKPYLHPLRSVSGKVVTRAHPMEMVEGESRDHPHHRGLWFTHGNVNGFDFWANEPSQKGAKKGKVVTRKVGALVGGKKLGTVDTIFEWQDPQGKALLVESRKMTFYPGPAMRIIDFDITLRALERVVFGDTKEGTFALRLASALEEPMPKSLPEPKRTGLMTDSEGRQGEKAVWGKRAAWVDYCGEIEGEKLGITIMDHPTNPKHPTFWHSRSYGLFAANIFGERDFSGDKTRDGSVTVEQGQALRFLYRVVIHSGDSHTAGIADLYNKYIAIKIKKAQP